MTAASGAAPRRAVVAAAILALPVFAAHAQTDRLEKATDDIETKYTTVGSIGLTITNFGTIGTRNIPWPRQPSCEFPLGSGVEHIYQGGLWVGARIRTHVPGDRRNNNFFVSTATSDQSVGGQEYTNENGDTLTQLTSLESERPLGALYSTLAVSHQDFISRFTDAHTRDPQTADSIIDHTPLGITVYQESYAWNFPFADFFVILRYVVTNTSADTLDSVYVGVWNNAVVRNTNLVRPRTPGYFEHGAHGYEKNQRMIYSFDWDGIPGGPPADSYIGFKLLGTTPFPSNVHSLQDLISHTYTNAWQFRSSTGEQAFKSPTDDETSNRYLSRYARLSQSMDSTDFARLRLPAPTIGLAPVNATYLLSTGPFSRLEPGDSVEVVYAVICAKKVGNEAARLDKADQRATLVSDARWAQQAYNGEDVNGNDSLDAGEDFARRDSVSPSETGLRYEPDGHITRYLLPTPPRQPRVRAEVENQQVVVYWDSATSEESVDPVTNVKDFEGYRVYRSIIGDDFLNHENFLLNLALVGEFDRDTNRFGYNTGLGRVRLDSAKTFPGDSIKYRYRFPPKGSSLQHLNGWQYVYGVSAFDRGDSANRVSSLESAKVLRRVVPGTPATSAPDKPIGVYPNPYYANAAWDGGRERLRKIYFYNLPQRCQIRIYTLAGDVVASLDHDAATYDGTSIEWFNQFGDRTTQAQFAGGEHAWDLITRNDQAIATGLYLFTVEDIATGRVKRGKFMIIK